MKFYRYEDDDYPNGIKIDLSIFLKLRETECGYWIYPQYLDSYSDFKKENLKRWISKTSAKRYAYPTKLEAIKNLIMRKRRQIEHSKYFLNRAQIAKGKAKIMCIKLENGFEK
ncbi:MAG: hypothetical protein GWP06_06120 [Actinobacteria bacterium]|nr:hypothetical protein [Actinomycetota bacterium]